MGIDKEIRIRGSEDWTLGGESGHFNEMFPLKGNWLGVVVKVKDVLPSTSPLKKNARTFDVFVKYTSGSGEREVFVGSYEEGDPDDRMRVEKLLAEDYPNIPKDTRKHIDQTG
jgi:hypothetical protein